MREKQIKRPSGENKITGREWATQVGWTHPGDGSGKHLRGFFMSLRRTQAHGRPAVLPLWL